MRAVFEKPVVCTNATGMWALLRHLGGTRPITGYGRLLAEHLGG